MIKRKNSSTGEPDDEKVEDTDWVAVYSKTYQRHYYHNKKTGETTWAKPGHRTSKTRRPSGKQKRTDSERSTGSANVTTEGGDSSDEGDATTNTRQLGTGGDDYDPELFQKKMMEQFPALKKAFTELDEGRRRLQKEREEHEARVRRELDIVNSKLEELRKLTDSLNLKEKPDQESASSHGPVGRRDSVTSSRPRKMTLEQDLRRYSMDLERRSISVVEKRRSMRTASGVRPDDLRSVVEEANRLAAERGNAPATAESAALQMGRISSQFSGTLTVDSDEIGNDQEQMQEIASEMEGVQRGLEYAMKEAEAQNEAAEEAQAVGDENDYYTLLGVPAEAGDAELKKAYRRKLIEWHPDKVKAEKREQAVKMTDVIQNAYRVLSDPWEREIYDWFGFQQYLLHVKVLECFKNYLVAGIELVKHPRKGRPRKRVVWLDKDLGEILTFKRRVMEDQRNGKEKIKGVAISTITNVTTGRATDVLKRTGRASHNERYFSLVCADRTLDFECPSEESCSFIATRMKLLIIDLKRDREWMHRHYDELEQSSA